MEHEAGVMRAVGPLVAPELHDHFSDVRPSSRYCPLLPVTVRDCPLLPVTVRDCP